MRKHGFLFASAGFWYLLQLAASYYLIITLRDPGMSQAEKLLLLWFGSPTLIVAGIFFFLYFRPERYAILLNLGQLSLGLGIAVALFTIVGMIGLNLAKIGFAIDSRMELFMLFFLGLTILVNLVFLLLLRNRDQEPPEVV
jgi:hypothetical protein